MAGKFITFEGGEGSGKSTQVKLLEQAFIKAGLNYVLTREPGGVPGAEDIRKLLVTGKPDMWNPMSETLLFYAARSEHVSRLIQPALADGRVVLCDRFADSTMVYQGIGKGLSSEYILALHHLTLGNFAPNLTFILDIDPTEGLRRAGQRHGDETRFERMDMEFHQQVRAGFLAIAAREPERCVVLNATAATDSLHGQILDSIRKKTGLAI